MNYIVKIIFAYTTFGFFSCSISKENLNNCIKCDIRLLTIVKENPSKANIRKVICTLSNDCLNNVEFMEFSNEILFFLLEKETLITIREISKTDHIKQNLLLSMINEPINDGIDINKIRTRIMILKGKNKSENEMIERILSSLR